MRNQYPAFEGRSDVALVKWACWLLSGPIPTQRMPLVTWLSCRHLWQLIAHGSARQSSENCLSTSVFDPALIC